jgi:hypothetical protein
MICIQEGFILTRHWKNIELIGAAISMSTVIGGAEAGISGTAWTGKG